jgi:Ser/Thr protein kinase RdoA (MazF antagonist)
VVPNVPAPSQPELIAIAEAFHGTGAVEAVLPLGNGNVNDTYLVEAASGSTVLQRVNTQVFTKPHLVMQNLQVLGEHIASKLQGEAPHPLLEQRRWQLPTLVCTQTEGKAWHCDPAGGIWRTITYVPHTTCVDVVQGATQARELGLGLGLFHLLISDLPPTALADTLEGFHITPGYLAAYHRALVNTTCQPNSGSDRCIAFIRERESQCDRLERAKQRGELPLRPIHGDPKINNVLLDRQSGEAVALIDLDTVKPGLVHYDIGDCLRSCCNPLGEETDQIDAVHFDLNLADAVLEGYLAVAGSFLSEAELRYIPDAAQLISFELGLRFFSDYLMGNTYFKASHPEHNLQRALVQFQLTASIESQMPALRQLVERHATAASV